MNKKQWIIWTVVAVLVVFLGWKLYTAHFDWERFWRAMRQADMRLIGIAILIIYTNYVLRAMRWAIFLKPVKQVSWWKLIGSQFIGFAGLAIFGRLGELIRPYLVARRTDLTFSSQIAVVMVERIFDLGAFAILFSLNLLLSPELNKLPYHEKFHAVGYTIAAITVVFVLLVVAVRLAGGVVAAMSRRFIGMISHPAGEATAEKIIAFRNGLNTIANLRDFVWASVLSLILWGSIAVAYVEVMHAFPNPVHSLTISHTLILMGFSVVGSVVQLPGVGGGSQVGTISALTLLFSIPAELAFSAGIMLWLVTFMSVIPAGLIFAQLEKVSLKKVVQASEAASEAISQEAV
ncbi:MAG: lysylphosphatidylglycerol synthase transmembrane domain-containing protein [Acidobacteriaceae bacterium]